MQMAIFRLIAVYIMGMGVATCIHVILSPALYVGGTSAPLPWLIMNPMNCVAAILMLIVTVIRKIQYDRSRLEDGATESAVRHIDVNVPVYAAAALSILYPINTIHEIASPGTSILAIWYYLDAALTILGITVGVRILRASRQG